MLIFFLTDKLSRAVLVEKTFIYISGLARECRKALTVKFEREHRGIPFNSVEAVMRREVESWFASRDRNIKLSYVKGMMGRSGETDLTYSGETKDAHFKFQVNGLFTLVDSSGKVSSYIKSLNLNVDKRDFTP